LNATLRAAADRPAGIDASPISRKIARYSNRGDVMRFFSGTPKILLIYVVCMIAGQAVAVGIGLLLDPYSKTLALSVFIPLYYAMYWVAWRVALLIGDTSPVVDAEPAGGDSGSRAKAASWLLAPAVLALDFCD
jgi:hypothetical protein